MKGKPKASPLGFIESAPRHTRQTEGRQTPKEKRLLRSGAGPVLTFHFSCFPLAERERETRTNTLIHTREGEHEESNRGRGKNDTLCVTSFPSQRKERLSKPLTEPGASWKHKSKRERRKRKNEGEKDPTSHPLPSLQESVAFPVLLFSLASRQKWNGNKGMRALKGRVKANPTLLSRSKRILQRSPSRERQQMP